MKYDERQKKKTKKKNAEKKQEHIDTYTYKTTRFGKKIQAKRKSISAVDIENSTICTPETCKDAASMVCNERKGNVEKQGGR